jgi:hypothetical protein
MEANKPQDLVAPALQPVCFPAVDALLWLIMTTADLPSPHSRPIDRPQNHYRNKTKSHTQRAENKMQGAKKNTANRDPKEGPTGASSGWCKGPPKTKPVPPVVGGRAWSQKRPKVRFASCSCQLRSTPSLWGRVFAFIARIRALQAPHQAPSSCATSTTNNADRLGSWVIDKGAKWWGTVPHHLAPTFRSERPQEVTSLDHPRAASIPL